MASPGERWRDVDHRVNRCERQRSILSDPQKQWSIDEAVTENLDLRELLVDYCSTLTTADECQTAFGVLSSLTVCDPTAGSGAFLFAALDVLQPLYETVLARAAEIHARAPDNAPAAFLTEANNHHSHRHWIIKTVCLHNLYGLDIMAEAPEIAKLRLFLKLAAQIENLADIEPLPDLDFNIKTGNMLVGIADHDDARTRFGEAKLVTDEQIAKMDALADEVAEAQDEFVSAQSQDTGDTDLSDAKQQLNERLQAARSEANRLLHELRVEQAPLEEWVDSHQPFHWFLEFPGVWRNGGFDVILGNPPYIKANSVKSYKWQGYQTQGCPDLYAVCTERASRILSPQGRMSMIVMHSLCFSHRFLPLREYLEKHFQKIWVSSYSRIPAGLFSGSARVRNSILTAGFDRSDTPTVRTSRCRRWLTESRPTMFASVEYTTPDEKLLRHMDTRVWPFIDSPPLDRAFRHMLTNNKPLGDMLGSASAPHRLAYKKVAQYMLGVSAEPPPTEGESTTSRYGFLHFYCADQRDLALLILAGRWGYLWWLTFSDEFHVTRSTLAAFPGDVERLASLLSGRNPAPTDVELVRSLVEMSRDLQQEMPRHLAWKQNSGVRVGRYNMLPLRYITDEADLVLAKWWGIEEAYEAAGNLRDRMVFGNRE